MSYKILVNINKKKDTTAYKGFFPKYTNTLK